MRRGLAPLALIVALATSCGGRAHAPLELTAVPRDAPADTPVTIAVSGASPSAHVVVTATTRDAFGVTWRSRAVYVADEHGRVELRTSPALSGTYRGTAPMGLFWSMRRVGSAFPPAEVTMLPPATQHVELTATAGSRASHVTLARRWRPPGVVLRRETKARDGFVGCYFAPSHPQGKIPGVVILGGSEGGLHCDGDALLAAHGLAVLDVAYFGYPTLPRTLERIPIEYFCGALRWLGGQPGVDTRRLAIWGISYGAEAAMLAGVDCPLAHAVVEAVGRDIADAGCCSGQSAGEPAWTVHGRAIREATPLPIARIHGPVLLLGGEQDALANSGQMADQMARALEASHHRVVKLAYAGAGHAIGFAPPFIPVGDTIFQFGIPTRLGGTLAADARARADAWPRVIAFLQGTPAG